MVLPMKDLIAIVLGGGEGKRLKPLTHLRAKAAIPFAGKHRLVDISLSNCINSEISRIFVLTQFNSASLNKHVATTYSFDRFSESLVTVVAAEQRPASMNWHQGSADAIRSSWQRFQSKPYKHTLVLYGDQLYAMDYRKMYAQHLETNADITMATFPVAAEDAYTSCVVEKRDAHRISAIHEMPHEGLDGKESPVSREMASAGRNYLASMGVYIFKRDILLSLLTEHINAVDFRRHVLPIAIKSRHVCSYTFEDYWRYIGSIDTFYSANLMLTNPHPAFDLYDPTWPIYSSEEQLPHSRIEGCEVNCVLIGQGCQIESSRITDAIIGNGSYLASGSVITNSYLMGSDNFAWQGGECVAGVDYEGLYVGEGTVIDGAIIDKNVRIGTGCTITNPMGIQHLDGDGYYIRNGIIIITKDSCIKSGTVISGEQEPAVFEEEMY